MAMAMQLAILGGRQPFPHGAVAVRCGAAVGGGGPQLCGCTHARARFLRAGTGHWPAAPAPRPPRGPTCTRWGHRRTRRTPLALASHLAFAGALAHCAPRSAHWRPPRLTLHTRGSAAAALSFACWPPSALRPPLVRSSPLRSLSDSLLAR